MQRVESCLRVVFDGGNTVCTHDGAMSLTFNTSWKYFSIYDPRQSAVVREICISKGAICIKGILTPMKQHKQMTQDKAERGRRIPLPDWWTQIHFHLLADPWRASKL